MKKLLLSLLLCVGASLPGIAQPMIQNGGFETGDFTGWTPGGTVAVVTGGAQRTGNFAASFGVGAATLSQVVGVGANVNNSVRFFLASTTTDPGAFFITAFGSATPLVVAPGTVTAGGYQEFIATFNPGATTTAVLTFSSFRTSGAFLLDDVEVFIPELNAASATLPLLLVAGLLFVAADRRRVSVVPLQQ